ncbi:hypothetical protein ACU6TU_12360 [Halomonas sp. LS-001]
MGSQENQTSKGQEEDVLQRRKPENFEKSVPQQQPEAKKPAGKLPWVLLVVIVGVVVLLAAWLLAGAD